MQTRTVSRPRPRRLLRLGYRYWRGLFYPEGLPQKRWFERYAEEFDTVEINASFYRLPLDHFRRLAGKGAGWLSLRR